MKSKSTNSSFGSAVRSSQQNKPTTLSAIENAFRSERAPLTGLPSVAVQLEPYPRAAVSAASLSRGCTLPRLERAAAELLRRYGFVFCCFCCLWVVDPALTRSSKPSGVRAAAAPLPLLRDPRQAKNGAFTGGSLPASISEKSCLNWRALQES